MNNQVEKSVTKELDYANKRRSYVKNMIERSARSDGATLVCSGANIFKEVKLYDMKNVLYNINSPYR